MSDASQLSEEPRSDTSNYTFIHTGMQRFRAALAKAGGHPAEHLEVAVRSIFEHLAEWNGRESRHVEPEETTLPHDEPALPEESPADHPEVHPLPELPPPDSPHSG